MSAKYLTNKVKVDGPTVSLAMTLREWRLDLSIQTAAPFRLQIREGVGPQPDFWSMECGGRRRGHGFFGTEILGLAVDEWKPKLKEAGVEQHSTPFHVGLMMFAHRALVTCAKGPGKLVQRMDPRLRFRAYQLLCLDPSQRLAQLRVANPGAFVLLTAMGARKRTAPLAEALRRDVLAGRKLNHALREALTAVDPRVDERRLQTWLALLRRAPPTLHSMGVLVAPPAGIAIDDVPAHPVSRRCWFEIVSWLGNLFASGPARPSDFAMAEFISRHGLQVGHWLRRHQRDLPDLLRFVARTRRVVGRSVDPVAVLRDFARYEEPLKPFPPAPLPALQSEEARLEHVADRAALRHQALSFRNCARRYAREVELGGSAFYVGTVRGRRVMVQLVEDYNGWSLEAMRGTANRLPTDDELAVVEQWVSLAELHSLPPARPCLT